MKNNLTKSKVWQIIGVAVLCAVCVLGAVLGVLFGMNHSSEDLNVSKDMSNQDNIVVETVQEQGIKLTSGVATTAADGTTTKAIKATVTPENTLRYDKLVWAISFKNADSAWAKGKNLSEYVTISVSEDSLTCTVTCKKAFSESIVVSVKDQLENASASAYVEYLKRVVDYRVTFSDEFGNEQYCDSSNEDTDWDTGVTAFNVYGSNTTRVPEYTVSWQFTFSEGTVEAESEISLRAGSLGQNATLQFDEQSEYGYSGIFEFSLRYNGNNVGNWCIRIIEPMRSISLSQSTITF